MADQIRLWELLAKQFNGHISEEELRELQTLLNEDPILFGELLSELRNLSLRPLPEEKAAKNNSMGDVLREVRQRKENSDPAADPLLQEDIYEPRAEIKVITGRHVKASRTWTGLAALLLLLTGVWLIWKNRQTNPRTEPYDRIVTKTGSRTLINLPDSSTVVLNSACQFSYNKDFGVKKREMQLTGEAFFDIHGNPDIPLVVHAGNVNIRVLGTSFNVRAYAEDSFVEATLVKGVIEVSLRSDPERKILLRPNEKIVIRNQVEKPVSLTGSSTPNPREEVIRVTKVVVDPGDSSLVETAWLKEKLVFRKESFASLAKRMERWYQVKIVLTDTSLQSLLFTGSFEKETVEEAFRALQHSASFGYVMDGRTIVVTTRK